MKLFVKVWCPWCVSARDWLDQRGYQYELLDVEKDHDAFEEMKEISGQTKTPTMELPDGKVLADFGPEELEEFLKKHHFEP